MEILGIVLPKILMIIGLVFTIVKYFSQSSLDKIEKEKYIYDKKMRVLQDYKGIMPDVIREKITREINFHIAFGIALSDDIISNIWRVPDPKKLLDNIEVGGCKLKQSEDGTKLVYRYSVNEKWVILAIAFMGLGLMSSSLFVLSLQNGWLGFMSFVLQFFVGLFMMIPTSQDWGRYQAADATISDYNSVILE